MKRRLVYLAIFFCIATIAKAQDLRTEPSINQGDIPTADVFRKGEWSYNQPLLFSPGWMRWGVTDRFTMQYDLMAWLGGLPDMNVRYALWEQKENSPRLALEGMYLWFSKDNDVLDDLNKNDKHLLIHREGSAGFLKLNGSFPVSTAWIFYWSVGASYSERYVVANQNRADNYRQRFTALWDPTATLGCEYRPSAAWAFHSSVSYGETVLFQENRPRKQQLVYGFRSAPWLDSKSAFLHNLRFELNSISVYFRDAHEGRSTGIPIVPYVYWQWRN